MHVALQKSMTVEQFLAWEERQELRYEFNGLTVRAMTGGTFAHDAISLNLIAALVPRLRGKPCQPHGSHLKIAVMGSIRYPDVFVSGTPIRLDATVAQAPVVIFEVLSKGTARIDRTEKNREYASTASVRRYVMLEQDAVVATVFERMGEDWVGHLLGADAVLSMPEIGIEVPLAEFYEGLDLSQPPNDEATE